MWTSDDLKKQLAELRIKGAILDWWVGEVHRLGAQNYFLNSAAGPVAEQTRVIEENLYQVWISKKLSAEDMGVAEGALFASQPLGPQIAALMIQAEVSRQKSWPLPKPANSESSARRYSPNVDQNLMEESKNLSARLVRAAKSEKSATFNSSEIYLFNTNCQISSSTGMARTQKSSEVYTEVCFSSLGKNAPAAEYMITSWSVDPAQIDLEEMCRESAKCALALETAEVCASGTRDVLVGPEVFAEVIAGGMTHLNLSQKYFSLPFRSQGEAWIEDFKGKNFAIKVRPDLDLTMAAGSLDRFGVPQQAMTLVDGNQVRHNFASPRFAHYFNSQPTTALGNIEIEASTLSFEELLRAQGEVFEILQLSAIFIDTNDLTFSSEIRLACLHRPNQRPLYFKNGNFSGSIYGNFKNPIWVGPQSLKHFVQYGAQGFSYSGPQKVLLNDISISG